MVLYPGLTELLQLFKENGWTSATGVIDTEDGLTCFKPGHETNYFVIKDCNNNNHNLEESIFVSVPLKNSSHQYVLYFNDYGKATTYMTKMFCYFNDIIIPIF